jgi:carboxypeptidase Taq
MKAWDALIAHNRETAMLSALGAIAQWDQQTCMPPKAAGTRGQQLAVIGRLVHERNIDPQLMEWVETVAAAPALTRVQQGAVRNLRRKLTRSRAVPADLVAAHAKAASDGFSAWVQARRDQDFDQFAPHLETLVGLAREQASAIDSSAPAYDVLLVDHAPTSTTASLRATFSRLSDGLVTLLDALRGAETPPAHTAPYDPTIQLQLFEEVSRALGYDLDAGRIDLAAHPFSTSLGDGDNRITVRTAETDLLSGLGALVHEAGHAMYEQGLPWDLLGTGVETAASMGLHESQSRLWENFVGRSLPFFRWLAPRIEARFGSPVDPEALYGAANRVAPGLIRVEADEVTYNLHVIIRFELEVALIEGSLAIADLPEAWNAAYRDRLGVEVPHSGVGVLQDVHWSAGMFGYFPSYTIGNLYAASLGHTLEAQVPDLWANIEAGEFSPILSWLRQGLHTHGHVLEAPELVRDLCGERDPVADLLDHLWSRHGRLHGVSR